jgi:hypothetical protein
LWAGPNIGPAHSQFGCGPQARFFSFPDFFNATNTPHYENPNGSFGRTLSAEAATVLTIVNLPLSNHPRF